jgi:hypothetical protein
LSHNAQPVLFYFSAETAALTPHKVDAFRIDLYFFANLYKSCTMGRIVLEVDDDAAKIFNCLTPEGKQKVGQAVSLMLAKVSNDMTFAEYSKLLDEVVNNGLTSDILGGLVEAIDEVKLIKQGKLKGIAAKDLLDEL